MGIGHWPHEPSCGPSCPALDLGDVEAKQEGERDEVLELVHVDADPLEVLLHALVVHHDEAVEDAEDSVHGEVHHEVPPYPLDHAAAPEGEQPEEGADLLCGGHVVDVGDGHGAVTRTSPAPVSGRCESCGVCDCNPTLHWLVCAGVVTARVR